MELLAQRFDHVEELGDRAGPAVRNDQRDRVGVVGPRVDEVDLLAVDLREVVRPAVEAVFLRAPVELRAPRVAQVLQVPEVGAVVPARAGNLVGPTRARQPLAQVVEIGLGNFDAERSNLGAHVRRRYCGGSVGGAGGGGATGGAAGGAQPCAGGG